MRKLPKEPASREITPESLYHGRRAFIKSAGLVLGAGLAAFAGRTRIAFADPKYDTDEPKNSFDLVVLLTLSNAVQNAIIGDDNSVTGGLIQLPQAKVYPTPVIPPAGTTDWDFVSSMSALGCATTFATLGWSCNVSGNDITHFNRPTFLAWLPDSTMFVADGYNGTRVELRGTRWANRPKRWRVTPAVRSASPAATPAPGATSRTASAPSSGPATWRTPRRAASSTGPALKRCSRSGASPTATR